MTKRHRSAVTGEYVTAEQAKADPERTVSESLTVKVDASEVADLLEQIRMEYANHLAALRSQVQTLEAAVAELRAAKGNNDNN